MNGSPSVKVALFIRNGGSESPCRWFYVTEIYTVGAASFGYRPITVNIHTTIHEYEMSQKLDFCPE